jgi:hypothetical protein
LRGSERARWILWWLLAIAVVLGSIGLFVYAVVSGEIKKELRPSNGGFAVPGARFVRR